MNESPAKESLVLFKASHDVELRGNPLQLTRYAAAFELYGTGEELRLSEALRCFRIMVRGRTIYAGRAVVRSLVETGPVKPPWTKRRGRTWHSTLPWRGMVGWP